MRAGFPEEKDPSATASALDRGARLQFWRTILCGDNLSIAERNAIWRLI
jgi:hypothetical protein